MKYLAMVMLEKNSEAAKNYEAGQPPDSRLAEPMMRHIEKMTKCGALVATMGLLPLAQGARVRVAEGKMTVTDGPFIESKEVIGGYAVLQADSKEAAIELTKQYLKIHLDTLGKSYKGTIEVREMFDPSNLHACA